MKTFTDLELIRLVTKDDKNAFSELYRRYYNKICLLIRRKGIDSDEIDDLTQDVFVDIWNQRTRIVITSSVNAYVYTIAKHKICNYIRQQIAKRYYEGQAIYDVNDNPLASETHADLIDIKRLIKNKIAIMPPKEQQIFKLSRFKYMTIADVAKETNISRRTVENYISHTLKCLRPIKDFYCNI